MHRLLYLHGFASGPTSRKAQFFCRSFEDYGISLEIPDLAEGDFERLTITGQLRVVERLAAGEPVALIGSSMGGYLAALYASRHPEVERLVLLAPAFAFARRWAASMGEDKLAEWRHSGALEMYHYGEKRPRNLGFQLLEDALTYDDFPGFSQPALIFHGTKDATVPWTGSVEYSVRHTNARLQVMDSDHDLTDVLDAMWAAAARFLLNLSQGR